MLRHPKAGQSVEIRYASKKRAGMRHGIRGVVTHGPGAGRGPRNARVRLSDGEEIVVPCGNLFPAKEG